MELGFWGGTAGQLLISGAATFFSVGALPFLVDSCLSKETAPLRWMRWV